MRQLPYLFAVQLFGTNDLYSLCFSSGAPMALAEHRLCRSPSFGMDDVSLAILPIRPASVLFPCLCAPCGALGASTVWSAWCLTNLSSVSWEHVVPRNSNQCKGNLLSQVVSD